MEHEALERIERRLEEIMSALTDLNDALARLAAEQTAVDVVTKATSLAVTDLVAEVANLLAAQGSGDTAAIESAVTGINSVVASLNADAATLATAASQDPGAQTPPTGPPVLDPATSLPLYVPAQGVVPDATWIAVTDVTGPSGEVLYTNTGDTVGSAPTAVSASWSLFQGALTTVPV